MLKSKSTIVKTKLFWFIVCFIVLVILNLFTDVSLWINIAFFVGFFFVLPLVRLIINRKEFMPYVREVERVMFSKPLDKDFWKKGELKKIKPKLVLKKNKKKKNRREKNVKKKKKI